MKHFLFIVLLGLVVSSCDSEKNRKTQNENGTKPIGTTSIEFEKTSFDFGQLEAGEIVVCTFTFTNTGTNAYQIKSVESDCGCISARFPQKTIAPGAKGRIEVEFDSSGMVGREYKSIEIQGNSSELKHLTIFAEVKNELFEIKY